MRERFAEVSDIRLALVGPQAAMLSYPLRTKKGVFAPGSYTFQRRLERLYFENPEKEFE